MPRRSAPATEGIPEPWIKFLTEAHDVSGTSHGPRGQGNLLVHLTSVCADLRDVFGCGEDVVAAGLFHSVYGTEGFQGECLPLSRRADVRAVIGDEAELVAFANCVMDRASFDSLFDKYNSGERSGSVKLVSRAEFADEPLVPREIELTDEQLLNLGRVHLADWIDLVASYNLWYYRRDAYAAIATALGGKFAAEHASVLATEPPGTTPETSDLPEMVAARQRGEFDAVRRGEIPYDELRRRVTGDRDAAVAAAR